MKSDKDRRIEYLETLIESTNNETLPMICGGFFKTLHESYGWSIESVAEMFDLTKHNIMDVGVTAQKMNDYWEKVNEKCRY